MQATPSLPRPAALAVPHAPTADDQAGIAWFNGLTEQRRAYWLSAARTSVARHAWDFYKLCRDVESQLRD